jgi:hypothetical protein
MGKIGLLQHDILQRCIGLLGSMRIETASVETEVGKVIWQAVNRTRIPLVEETANQ